MTIRDLGSLEALGADGLRALWPRSGKIVVGTSTCGLASGAEEVVREIAGEVSRQGLGFTVGRVGCLGLCRREPLMEFRRADGLRVVYHGMNPERAKDLVAALAQGDLGGKWALFWDLAEETGLAHPPQGLAGIPSAREFGFLGKQTRIALRNCGLIDPLCIEEYVARGGYLALFKALREMTPDEVIGEVKRSGLRGRSGSGFPTGQKWELCRAERSTPKYLVANGKGGDPGAFMDRTVLEGDPHAVIEGMAIAAYAVGAHEGYIYVRDEYKLAAVHLRTAIRQAEGLGLIGEDILGTGFDFRLRVFEGGGAFVCGESTALTSSMEGKRAMPKPIPRPRTTEEGLWGQPTVLNNVKTFALVPAILTGGADWFAGIGTTGSPGTHVFALTGNVTEAGLAEVPMGITIRELVYGVGGGPTNGNRCKAVQIGGPSGGFLPESLVDTPLDFDSLQKTGVTMGSGGIIVLDQDACMVDMARYFLEFAQDESCGQCPPCRLGTKRMLEVLNRIAEGRGCEGDLALLAELAETVRAASLCGLGQTAPNPILSTIRFFRDEYEAHIAGERCPAGTCGGPGARG